MWAQLLSHVQLFAAPWTGSSVLGIFQAKTTGVDCHFLLQRTFPTQGLNSCLLHPSVLAGIFFTTESPGKPLAWKCYCAVLSHV